MKKKEFLEILDPVTPKLYSFAYSMIPDDLQAKQLIVDAANIFFIKEKDFVESIATEWAGKQADRSLKSQYNKEIVRAMMEHLFKLGQRRFNQVFPFADSLKAKGAYYRELDTATRAVMFLKHKLNLNFNEIRLITDYEKYQIIERLYMGRKILTNVVSNEDVVREVSFASR
jgi:hypothetical protein